MDYQYVPTTVFVPLEYSACGYTEEDAIAKFGEENIEVKSHSLYYWSPLFFLTSLQVYHTHFKPLEYTVAEREDNACYVKVICNLQDNQRVLGIHYLGPNAGEVMQGYAAAIK